MSAHASWNGATGVARWELLVGPGKDALETVATATASGFETTLRAKTTERYVAVRALGADGATLGTSAAVAVKAR